MQVFKLVQAPAMDEAPQEERLSRGVVRHDKPGILLDLFLGFLFGQREDPPGTYMLYVLISCHLGRKHT